MKHCYAISVLADKEGYNLEQRNGQRVFGPPLDWIGEEPKMNCEVYIGHIPRGFFEDTLVPLFSICGKIYTFRLMMDFSGNNRGFGFCTFANLKDAWEACNRLNNYEITPGNRLIVMKSQDNTSIILSK